MDDAQGVVAEASVRRQIRRLPWHGGRFALDLKIGIREELIALVHGIEPAHEHGLE